MKRIDGSVAPWARDAEGTPEPPAWIPSAPGKAEAVKLIASLAASPLWWGCLLAAVLGLTAARPGTAAGTDPYAARRRAMVQIQLAARGIHDPKVLAAMAKVPRHRFVPPGYRRWAYSDQPLPIGFGQTISQPYIVAFMTQALELKGGEKVLEVGTGSGYQAAVLAEIAARVYSIEIIPQLSRRAGSLLAELGYHNLRLKVGDGYQGWPEAAPFDAIVVTCAPEKIPPPLVEQLAPGGRMIIPVGPDRRVQELVLVTKDHRGGIRQRAVLPVRFVPLVRETPKP